MCMLRAGGRAAVEALQHVVELAAVCCRDVLDVGEVFQAAFYLERGNASEYEAFEVVELCLVFQREVAGFWGYGLVVGVEEAVLHPAHLRTLSAVGRASAGELRGVALS